MGVTRAQIPRFAFEKFPGAKAELTTQMKSVGEAMGLGGTFQGWSGVASVQEGQRQDHGRDFNNKHRRQLRVLSARSRHGLSCCRPVTVQRC